MTRPREFDSDSILEKAMQAFWSNGYNKTSVDDLTQVTGLSRSSLYNAFGNKHDLFLRVLDRYNDTSTSNMVRRIDNAECIRTETEATLMRIVDLNVSGENRRGCMFCNSASELAAIDQDTAIRVSRGFERVEKAFARAIKRGMKEGKLRPGLDAQAIGRFLVSSINGLRAVAKTRPERAYLIDIVKSILTVYD